MRTKLFSLIVLKLIINMESYTFAGTSAHWYRIVDDQTFQKNKMQASLRYFSSSWFYDPTHVINH
jgi:hypothetical protein